jgi:arginine/ornithine N-succinyltransferase beta subunit
VADASAQALRAALERAGLRFAGHVRIDDGGPVMEAGVG